MAGLTEGGGGTGNGVAMDGESGDGSTGQKWTVGNGKASCSLSENKTVNLVELAGTQDI